MAKLDAVKTLRTKTLIQHLLENPPDTRAEAIKKLRSLDSALAAKMLVDVLENQALNSRTASFLMFALDILRLGKEKPRLIDILRDDRRPIATRGYAAMLLQRSAKLSDLLPNVTGENEIADFIGEYSIGQLFLLAGDKTVAKDINKFLLDSASVGMAELIFPKFETQRVLANVPAHIAYSLVLRNEDLRAIHSTILEIISKEGFSEGIALLEGYRNDSAEDKAKESTQKLILQSRSLHSGFFSSDQNIKGYCLLGTCDGAGAFVIMACRENRDGTITLGNLCLRVTGEVRDSFTAPRLDEAEITDMLQRFDSEANTKFVKIPLEEGSKLLDGMLKKILSKKRKINAETRRTLKLFPAPVGLDDYEVLDSPFTIKRYKKSDYGRYLSLPEFTSWFLDQADFFTADLDLPFEDETAQQYYKRTLLRLEASPIRRRLEGMADHMKKWYSYAGDTESAAFFYTISNEMENDFVKSKFVAAMLVKSLHIFSMD